MSKNLRAALVAFAVVGGLSFVSNCFAAGVVARGGAPPSAGMRIWPLTLGVVVYALMIQLGGNRAERRVAAGERAAVLGLVPPPGMALLVVMREGFVGKALGLDVAVDGRAAVQLRSPRAAVLPVAPGAHVVSVSAPKAAGDPLHLSLAPGEVAFVQLRLAMGMRTGTLTLARADDPAAARAALAKLPLVAPEAGWGETARPVAAA